MRILHVIPSYYPAVNYGGPIYAVHQLCAAQAGLGFEVDVFTTNRNGSGVSEVPTGIPVKIDGVNVYYFSCLWHLRFWYYSYQMSKAFKRQARSYDIVHIHSIFLWPTLGAAYYAKKYNIPYCISPRGSLVDGLIRKKSRFRKLIYLALFEKRSLRRAKFVHATSELESTEIRLLNIGIKNIEVVPNGINLSEYDLPNSTVHCGVSYILYLGRISWKKRIDLLLMAMPYINKQFELVIAGNDEEGELLKLTNVLKELQIENRVHFVGFIEGLKKVELIKNSSLLVLPSENENFGNVILEAWACRKPVAISKHVGLAEWVEKYCAGILISSKPEEMAAEINALLADSLLLKNLGDSGYSLANSNFQWSTIAKRLCALYQVGAVTRRNIDN